MSSEKQKAVGGRVESGRRLSGERKAAMEDRSREKEWEWFRIWIYSFLKFGRTVSLTIYIVRTSEGWNNLVRVFEERKSYSLK